MKHPIDLAERIGGTYWHAAAILKLDLDQIVKAPLEELRFEIGGGAVSRRVRAEVGPMISGPDSLRIPLHWTAAEHPNLFPVMDGDLHISDAGGNHIELRLVGEYGSPLGAVGAVADAVAGHRVAENSLRGFLTEVANRLRAELIEHTEGLWVDK
jgi:hypothetical protein